jgi:hypothetical protein
MFGSLGWMELILILVIIFVLCVPMIFYIRTLNLTLALTQKHHTASLGSAWLLLIPIWGSFWIFYIVGKVAQGLKGRFSELKVEHEDVGRTTWYGYGYAGLMILISLIPVAEVVGLAAIGILICWILYWVNIARYNKVLIGKGGAAKPPACHVSGEL